VITAYLIAGLSYRHNREAKKPIFALAIRNGEAFGQMGIFDLLSNGSGGGRKNGIQTAFIGIRGLRLFWFFQTNNFWRMERFKGIGPFNKFKGI
jgi:hypothetical protein